MANGFDEMDEFDGNGGDEFAGMTNAELYRRAYGGGEPTGGGAVDGDGGDEFAGLSNAELYRQAFAGPARRKETEAAAPTLPDPARGERGRTVYGRVNPDALPTHDELAAKGKRGGVESAMLNRQAETGIESDYDGSWWGGIKNGFQAFAHAMFGRPITNTMNANLQALARGTYTDIFGNETPLEQMPDSTLDYIMDNTGANGLAGARAFLGEWASHAWRGEDNIMRQWDEREGVKFGDEAERKRARVAYAKEFAQNMISLYEESKLAATDELAAREETFTGALGRGLLEQGGYTGRFMMGPYGIVAGLLEGAERAGELLSDKTEVGEGGEISAAAKRDTMGTALAKGAARGVMAPAVELVGGKLLMAGAKGAVRNTLGRIPLVKAAGGKLAATAAGKSVAAFARKMDYVGRMTGMGSFPEEMAEEWEDQVLDAAVGLDRRASENEGTTALGRARESNSQFFTAQNLGDLAKSMVLMQVIQGGAAHALDRMNARRVDAVLENVCGIERGKVRNWTANQKQKAFTAWVEGLSEGEVRTMVDGGSRALNRFMSEMFGGHGMAPVALKDGDGRTVGRALAQTGRGGATAGEVNDVLGEIRSAVGENDFTERDADGNPVERRFTPWGEDDGRGGTRPAWSPATDEAGNPVLRLSDAENGVTIDRYDFPGDDAPAYRVRDARGRQRAADSLDNALAAANGMVADLAQRNAKLRYVKRMAGDVLRNQRVFVGDTMADVRRDYDRQFGAGAFDRAMKSGDGQYIEDGGDGAISGASFWMPETDADGRSTLVPATNRDGSPVYETDAKGKPVLDAAGNPVRKMVRPRAVFFALDNNRSIAELNATAYHEVARHSGLAQMYTPEEKADFLRRLSAGSFGDAKNRMDWDGLVRGQMAFRGKKSEAELWKDPDAVEEIFAVMTEGMTESPSLKQRFMANVYDWYRSKFKQDLGIQPDELAVVVDELNRFARRGGGTAPGGGGVTYQAREGRELEGDLANVRALRAMRRDAENAQPALPYTPDAAEDTTDAAEDEQQGRTFRVREKTFGEQKAEEDAADAALAERMEADRAEEEAGGTKDGENAHQTRENGPGSAPDGTEATTPPEAAKPAEGRESGDTAASVALAADKANGTQLSSVVRLATAIETNDGAVKSELAGKHFRLAKTSDTLKGVGLTGDFFTVRSGVVLRHNGKDAAHNITPTEWVAIADALANRKPLLVETRNADNSSFRIWTRATIGGRPAIVGADVKNAGRELTVNSIATTFGAEGIHPKEDGIVYPKSIEEARSVLTRLNSGRYTASPQSADSIAQPVDGVKPAEGRSGAPDGGGVAFDRNSTVLSGDEVRKTMPGYDPKDWRTHVDRTGYVGPRLEAQFQHLLKTRKGRGNGTVLFLAGGNGAGKSTAAERQKEAPDFTIDSTLGNLDAAKRQIDAILANGQTPVIHFVYRTPGQALEGIGNRVANGGHTVSPLSFANSHVKSRENLRLLSEAYGDKLKIRIFDNSVDGAPEITLEQLEAREKPDHARIREEADRRLGQIGEHTGRDGKDNEGGAGGSGAKGEGTGRAEGGAETGRTDLGGTHAAANGKTAQLLAVAEKRADDLAPDTGGNADLALASKQSNMLTALEDLFGQEGRRDAKTVEAYIGALERVARMRPYARDSIGAIFDTALNRLANVLAQSREATQEQRTRLNPYQSAYYFRNASSAYLAWLSEKRLEDTPARYAEWTEAFAGKPGSGLDAQGNPVNADGSLNVEAVGSVENIADEDFTSPRRNIELPKLPANIDAAFGADGKPVVIKRNIFARNRSRHADITPEQSREILRAALYSPNLYGQNQKTARPHNWVVVNVGKGGKNRLVLLEVNRSKDNIEVVHWHNIRDTSLETLKRQAAREGGQFLILHPSKEGQPGALSGRPGGVSKTEREGGRVPILPSASAKEAGGLSSRPLGSTVGSIAQPSSEVKGEEEAYRDWLARTLRGDTPENRAKYGTDLVAAVADYAKALGRGRNTKNTRVRLEAVLRGMADGKAWRWNVPARDGGRVRVNLEDALARLDKAGKLYGGDGRAVIAPFRSLVEAVYPSVSQRWKDRVAEAARDVLGPLWPAHRQAYSEANRARYAPLAEARSRAAKRTLHGAKEYAEEQGDLRAYADTHPESRIARWLGTTMFVPSEGDNAAIHDWWKQNVGFGKDMDRATARFLAGRNLESGSNDGSDWWREVGEDLSDGNDGADWDRITRFLDALLDERARALEQAGKTRGGDRAAEAEDDRAPSWYGKADEDMTEGERNAMEAFARDELDEIEGANYDVMNDPHTLFRRSTPGAEAAERARREYDAVVARHTTPDGTRKASWMKAPNGRPTNLTERQWVQVRTPSFKKWFGDWERNAVRSFLEGAPVAEAVGDEYAGVSKGELEDAVVEYFKNKGVSSVTNDAVGKVNITRSGIHDSISKGVGRAKIAIFNHLPAIIANGRVVAEETDWKGRNYDTAVIASPVAIGGKPHVAFVVVRRHRNGDNNFYLHEVGLLDDIKKEAERLYDTGLSPDGGKVARPLGSLKSIAKDVFSVNPDFVSKVVDGNGEPLVVYHGTKANFTQFAPNSHFGGNVEQALDRIGFYHDQEDFEDVGTDELERRATSDGNVVMRGFLNIRNPLTLDTDLGSWRPKDFARRGVSTEGHDGVVYDNWHEGRDGEPNPAYIVFSPSQIKSATDNTGAFDAANPDIRFSIAGWRGLLRRNGGNIRGLADAKEMEKSGADRTAIWRRTGWWRGVDGEWRFELPPVRMRDERALYAALIEGGNETTLGRLLDAPELFKAYPQLEDTKIVLSPKEVNPGEPAGWYDRLKNEIVLFDAGIVSLKDMPEKERGLRDHYERILNSDEYLNRMFAKMDEFGMEHGTVEEERENARQWIERQKNAINRTNAARIRAMANDRGKRSVFGKIVHEVQHAVQRIEGFAGGASGAEDGYHRFAGEVEARNAARRDAMTPEERAATPPWETEDVPADSQNIRFSIRRDVTADPENATLENAKTALKALSGVILHNDATGIDAQINAVQRNKIVSNAAVRKSNRNGFTTAEHNAAASIIDRLWKHAELAESRADNDGDPNIASIKRFVSIAYLGDKEAFAYITAKESTRNGHRIYSIELEKLEALEGKLKDLGPSASSAMGEIVARLRSKVNTSANENRIAGLGLKEETDSQLKPSRPGDDVKTPEDFTSWRSTVHSVAQPGAGAQGPDVRFSIPRLYTGSAADYERPSLHAVGTGEGSQVYGWGLYASNRRGVAESYAKINDGLHIFDGRPIEYIPVALSPQEKAIKAFTTANGDKNRARETLVGNAKRARGKSRKEWDDAVEWFDENGGRLATAKPHLYEQTFFTDRAPGDESHLLNWYEMDNLKPGNLLHEQLKWIRRQAKAEGVKLPKELGSYGNDVYNAVADALGSPKAASEFLARAGIDGVKYPVDSYGGKTVKDGDAAGWNYVSFRDDNIRVDHKWTDGGMVFRRVTPEEDAAYMDAVRRGDMEAAEKMKRDAVARAMPNTKVVGADGKPMKVYHGSRTGANIKIFRTPSFFSDNRDVADMFKKEADFILRVNGKEVAIDDVTARQIADELTKGDYTPDEMADWGSFAESIGDIEDNGKGYGGRDVIADALGGVGIDTPLDEITEMSFMRVPDIYECYVNITNPLEIDFKGKTWGQEGTREMEAAVRNAAKNGYDGVIVRNIQEGGFLGELRNGEEPPLSTDYIPVSPNQIKLADAVTRDDAGSVIPLSQRFNPQNSDIRFSVRLVPDLRETLTLERSDEATAKTTVKGWRSERKTFTNRRNGRTAELKADWTKIFSEPAKKKSANYAAHYAAANRLDTLFENGVRMWGEPPRNGSQDIRAYAKYGCPFEFGGETYLAKITVKEYADGKTTDGFYSIEAISVEKIGAGGINAGITSIEGHELDPGATAVLKNMLQQTPHSVPHSADGAQGGDGDGLALRNRRYTPDPAARLLADALGLSAREAAALAAGAASAPLGVGNDRRDSMPGAARDLVDAVSGEEGIAAAYDTTRNLVGKLFGKGAAERWRALRRGLQRRLTNYLEPVVEMQRLVERRTLHRVRVEDSVADAAKFAYSHQTRMWEDAEREVLTPLYGEIAKNGLDAPGKSVKEGTVLHELLLALHGPAFNRMISERTGGRTPDGSGASTAFWLGVLRGHGANGTDAQLLGALGRGDYAGLGWAPGSAGAKAAKAVALVRELTNRTRDVLERSGRLGAGQRRTWEALSPFYVPMRFDQDADDNFVKVWLHGGTLEDGDYARNYAGGESRHAFGHRNIADNPIVFAIQQHADAIQRATDNDVRRKLADMVRRNEFLGHVVDADGIVDMGGVVNPNAPSGFVGLPRVKTLGSDTKVHESTAIGSLEQEDNIVAFKEGGDVKFIVLGPRTNASGRGAAEDRALSEAEARLVGRAVKKTSLAQVGPVLKFIRGLTRTFGQLRTTLSPEFLVSNFLADNAQAAGNVYATFGARGVAQFERGVPAAVASARRMLNGTLGTSAMDAYAHEMRESGGLIGGLSTANFADVQRDVEREVAKFAGNRKVRVLDFIAHVAERMNAPFEVASRLSAYAVCRRNGMTRAEAAKYAREVTVDFNQKGEWTPVLNALYAFSNASLVDMERSFGAYAARRGLRLSFALVALGFLSSMLGYWQDDPEDEREGAAQWKDTKDYVKQNKLGFRAGTNLYSVPIRGVNRVLYYAGHKLWEVVSGRQGAGGAAWSVGTFAASNLTDPIGDAAKPLQAVTPSVLRPGMELLQNESFSGAQIYREPMNRRLDVRSAMGRRTTPGIWHNVAEALNAVTGGNRNKRGAIDVQPEVYQYVYSWLTGSAGNDIARAANVVRDIAAWDFSDMEDTRNVPFVRRFTSGLQANTPTFREKMDEFNEDVKQFKDVANEDPGVMADLRARHPFFGTSPSARRWLGELTDLGKAARKLMKAEMSLEGEDRKAAHRLRLQVQAAFIHRFGHAPEEDTADDRAFARRRDREAAKVIKAGRK